MSVFIYCILTVKTRFMYQRPKDYLYTEYFKTGFICLISTLGQYDKDRNHSIHIEGIYSTEQGRQNYKSQIYKGQLVHTPSFHLERKTNFCGLRQANTLWEVKGKVLKLIQLFGM